MIEKTFACKSVPVKSALDLAWENLDRVLNRILTPEEQAELAERIHAELWNPDGTLRL